MILLNFSHPLSLEQQTQLEAMVGCPIVLSVVRMLHLDEQQPFEPQVAALVDGVELSAEQWQTEPILVVLPALNFVAAALLANLHGRMGYFPSVVRTRAVEGAALRRFEIAEVLDLQAARAAARRSRINQS